MKAFLSTNPRLIVSVLIFSLTGCSSLKVYNGKDSDEIPKAGAPYQLSYTQFEIDLHHRIERCPNPNSSDDRVLISTKINSVTSKKRKDPENAYVIDMASLEGVSKSSNLDIAYHPDGSLASVNATSTDKISDVVEDVVDTIIEVATGGLPDDVVKQSLPEGVNFGCTERIQKVVTELIPTARKQLENINASFTTELENFRSNRDLVLSLGKLASDSQKQELSMAVKSLIDQRKVRSKLISTLQSLIAEITVEKRVVWPHNGETFSGGPFAALSSTKIVDYVDINLARIGTDTWVVVENADQLINKTQVFLRITPDSPEYSSLAIQDTDSRSFNPEDGFVYRLPTIGRLQACVGSSCFSEPDEDLYQTIATGEYEQLGPKFALPLKSGPFSDKTINIAFEAETGALTKLGTESKSTADQVSGVIAEKTQSYLESEATKELREVQAETELLTAKSALRDAKLALSKPVTAVDPNSKITKETDATAAETALIQARIDNIKAQEELRDLENLLEK